MRFLKFVLEKKWDNNIDEKDISNLGLRKYNEFLLIRANL